MARVDVTWPDELVELRNYRLVPGGADAFVDHFEQHFLASQEALGMDVVGQFRVLDDPDRFVWVRRFLDPRSRSASLAQFYSGPVWAEHGPRANELMVDHTDVHLLVPDPSAPGFAAGHVPHARRDGPADPTTPGTTVVAAIYDTSRRDDVGPALGDALGAALGDHPHLVEIGRLATASAPNEFPRLPVHDRTVAVWLLSDRAGGRLAIAAAETVAARSGAALHALRLAPTARSTLR